MLFRHSDIRFKITFSQLPCGSGGEMQSIALVRQAFRGDPSHIRKFGNDAPDIGVDLRKIVWSALQVMSQFTAEERNADGLFDIHGPGPAGKETFLFDLDGAVAGEVGGFRQFAAVVVPFDDGGVGQGVLEIEDAGKLLLIIGFREGKKTEPAVLTVSFDSPYNILYTPAIR